MILCILVTAFIGWNVLYLLSGRKGLTGFSFLEQASLSYLFGMGVLTIQMFIMSLRGIGYTRFNILLPWVVVVGLNLLVVIARRIRGFSVPGTERLPFPERKAGFRLSEVTLICLIALQTAYNFFRALMRPIESYDAVAIHGLKAKMIYLARGIGENFFGNLSTFFHGAHPDYPLLIPLSQTWVYTFLGNFNDILVKAIFPLFYLSFILVFYAVLKRITKSRFTALLFTFLLATVKQFSDYSTIGYADLEVGIYFALGLFYLYLWFREKEIRFFNISLISSILCLWTKNEGMLLVLVNIFVFLFYLLANVKKREKRRITAFLLYAAILIYAISAWNTFRQDHGLVNENFNLSMISIGNLIPGLGKIPAILYEYQKQFFGFKKWNIIWILSFFVFITGFKAAFSKNIKYITAALFLFALGYSAMYIFSAVDIKFFVTSTGSRFLLHILPVTVFWMAIVIHESGRGQVSQQGGIMS
ncbi:MAG: hypothetical protein WBC74_05325 [Candidatus Omnitrophota bacterium]